MELCDQKSIERLQGKLARDGECLVWPLTNCLHVIRKGRGQNTTPRRMSFELANGEVLDAAHVTDICGNRRCCNSAHLVSRRARFDDEEYLVRLKERFWQKVDKNGAIPAHCPELGNCWTWTGATLSKSHYGAIMVRWKKNRVGNSTAEYAHRLSYIWAHGSVPEGLLVCHKCDTPRCVRPDHLFTSTAFGNYFDSVVKGRMRRSHKKKEKPEKPVTLWVTPTYEQGAMLKAAREAKGETQPNVSAMFGVDVTHYSRIEKGRRGLDLARLKALIQYLGIDESVFNLSPEQYYAGRKVNDTPLTKNIGGHYMPYIAFERGAGCTWFRQLHLLPTPDLTFYRADLIRFRLAQKKEGLTKIARNAGIAEWTLKRVFIGENVRSNSLERIANYAGLSIEQVTVTQQKLAA